MMAAKDNAFGVSPELAAIRAKKSSTPATSVAGGSAVPGGSYKDYKRRRGLDFSAAAIATPAPNVEEEENKPWYKDLGEGALGAANRLLRTVDMPRAALVSATRELADAFDPNEDASFKDFRDQFNRRAGAGELLLQGPHFGIGEKGPLDEILGFGLDVVLDPLTYLTFGAAPAGKSVIKGAVMPFAKNAAEETADKAFRAAIKSGESKILSKKLQDVATASGFTPTRLADGGMTFGNDALDNLIVNTSLRGRGALTPQGLRAAGVSDELATQLRIPAMNRALGVGQARVALPGTGRLANVAENLKGDIKFKFRTRSAPANKSRDLFVSNVAGQRELYKRVAALSEPLGKRVASAVALRTVNESLGVTRTWVQDTARFAGKLFRDNKLAKLSEDGSRAFIKGLESNVLDSDAHVAVRGLFDRIRDRLVAAGAEVRYRENYVPHMITQDAFRLARRDPEVLKFLTENLLTKEGFQRIRTLDAGDPFMGSPLEFGTIDEINERFMAVYGKKLFEDDINVIVPRYIQNAGKALQRAEQVRLLGEAGIAIPIATKTVREALPDSDPFVRQAQDLVKRAERQIVTERKNIVTSRNVATDLRKQGVASSRAALRSERQRLVSARNVIKEDLRDLQRVATAATKRLQTAERKVQEAENIVETLRASLKETRDVKRGPLVVKLKAAEDRAASLKKQLSKVRSAKTLPDMPVRLQKKYAGPVAEMLAKVRQEYDDVTSQIAPLNDEINALTKTVNMVERSLSAANTRLDTLTVRRDSLVDAADAAAESHLFAIGSSRFAVEQLDRAVTQIDNGLRELGASPTVKPRVDVTAGVASRYRTQMENASRLLKEGNLTAEWEAVTKLEAAAAEADMAAMVSRDQIGLLEDMIAAAKDSTFRNVVKQTGGDGMQKVSATLETSDWMAQMFEIEDAFKQLPAFADWANRVLGVWKGYAILRPGFHVRNAYSGMYGMFLEAGAGSFKGVKDWAEYIRFIRKFPDETVRAEKAVAKFGAAKAKDLEDAWRAVNATGAGQIAGEMGKETFAGGSFNPLSNQFKLFNASRKAGERVEDLIRGTHAYDVIRRGGDMDMATDIVNKWQFNYSDITGFDRIMKMVNPFWIFFSRNIGLQSQSWVKSASRLNRSVVNFERNMGYGLPEEDREPPEWFRREGAIRIGGGDDGTDSPYLFTDLPAVVWPGDLQTLLVSNARDVGELASSLTPFAKVPIELATGKSLFTGADIPSDEFVPLPVGLRQVVNLTNLAPSGALERNADGEIMIRRDALNALVGLSPIAGQLDRLFPGTDVGKENATRARVAAGVGVGYRLNDERAQRGEEYRLYLEQLEEAKRRASLGF